MKDIKLTLRRFEPLLWKKRHFSSHKQNSFIFSATELKKGVKICQTVRNIIQNWDISQKS
jgi:hypothetical protein